MRPDLQEKNNEAKTAAQLFHPAMCERGYPAPDQVGATQYDQQGHLEAGVFDGCYLHDGRPTVLVELKKEGKLETETARESARDQVLGYALSSDFETPPPFILISDGQVYEMYERTHLDPANPEYTRLPRLLRWDEVIKHTPGRYTQRFVDLRQHIDLFRRYVKQIGADIRPVILRLREAERVGADSVEVNGREYDREAIRAVNLLLAHKKAASTAQANSQKESEAVDELTASAALSYTNKIFFLKYCEDRRLQSGPPPVLSQVATDPTAESKDAAYVSAFASLLKHRLTTADAWNDAAEAKYRELIGQIKRHVLDSGSWWEIIRAAFLGAEESFPVMYRPNPYDHLSPGDETIVSMLVELRSLDLSTLDQEMVGTIYQAILNEQYGQRVLGAFYTPPKTVDYMVSRLPLTRDSVTLEPACGSGHFVEACYRAYCRFWHDQAGFEEEDVAETVLEKQVVAFDIDHFAAQLAAMRLFFLSGEPTEVVPNIFVRDSLEMNLRLGKQAFMDAEGNTIFDEIESLDPRAKLSSAQELDSVAFDHVIGNPPYGGKPTDEKQAAYDRLYREPPGVYGKTLGSGDTFGLFVANAIVRTREGGIICLLISDSFLSIASHTELRQLILDTCKIREIVLAPLSLFRPVATSRTCILTLEKLTGAENAADRDDHTMTLVDRLEDEDQYREPPEPLVDRRRQSDYRRVPRNPFFIRVHEEVIALFENCRQNVGNLTEGGAGLQTGANTEFCALLEGSVEADEQLRRVREREAAGQDQLTRVYQIIAADEVVDFEHTSPPRPRRGFPDDEPHFVPFVRGSSEYQYVAPVERYVDYSETAVACYRASGSSGVLRNPDQYFKRGVVTNAHNRMLRGTLIENAVPAVNTNIFVPNTISVEFLLGLLNSKLGTYLCTKVINTSIGGLSAHPTPEDIRLIPFPDATEDEICQVEAAVARIVAAKSIDFSADCSAEQEVVDATIFSAYGLSSGAIAAVEQYWSEVLAEQVGAQ